MHWLPEPPKGTHITLGFDGSDVDDWTALRARTRDWYGFTPRHGDDDRPTIWIPAETEGMVPRLEVNAALDRIFDWFVVDRMYYDPPRWQTDGESWTRKYGPVVIPWETSRSTQMHAALVRYYTDLTTGAFTHDGCRLTATSMANAQKIPRGERYILGKKLQHLKIDPTMADVLAHEAAADLWAEGWPIDTGPSIFFLD